MTTSTKYSITRKNATRQLRVFHSTKEMQILMNNERHQHKIAWFNLGVESKIYGSLTRDICIFISKCFLFIWVCFVVWARHVLVTFVRWRVSALNAIWYFNRISYMRMIILLTQENDQISGKWDNNRKLRKEKWCIYIKFQSSPPARLKHVSCPANRGTCLPVLCPGMFFFVMRGQERTKQDVNPTTGRLRNVAFHWWPWPSGTGSSVVFLGFHDTKHHCQSWSLHTSLLSTLFYLSVMKG